MDSVDIGLAIVGSVLSVLSGYLLYRLKVRDEANVELEKRVAKLELSEAASSSAKEDLQELKKDLKELIGSVTNLRIEMARMSKGDKDGA